MPRPLADALFQHLLGRFPADRDRSRADIREAAMPPLVSRLLENLLDRRAERELRLSRSSWFDYGVPGAADAEDALLDVLRPTARIPAEEWESFLEGACYVAVEALVHPVRTLAAYVFDDVEGAPPETLPAETVRERLDSLAAYAYLPEVASAYLDRKGIPALSADALADLLRKIDQRRVVDLGPEEWTTLLDPLFSLAARVPDADGRVPTETLAAFFHAKDQTELAARVEAAGADELDADALREALGRSAPPPPEPLPPPPDFGPRAAAAPAEPETDVPEAADVPDAERPDAAEPAPQEVADDRETEGDEEFDTAPPHLPLGDGATPPPTLGVPQPQPPVSQETLLHPEDDVESSDSEDREQGEGPVPLWKQFRRPGRRPGSAPSDPPSPPPMREEPPALPPLAAPEPPAATTGDAAAGDVPLWQRFTHTADPDGGPAADEAPDDVPPAPPTTGNPDALAETEARVLGPAAQHHDWFVHELFDGSTDAYAETLRMLDAAPSWTEGSRIIAAEIFRRHRVDIYSPAAVAFTDAVEGRFRSES